MNNISINDYEFMNSNVYKSFINNNPGMGYLKIRAYSANQAVPIKGLKVLVNKKINGYNVNFFEGYTNESGTIEKISLPAPKKDSDDLVVPQSMSYEIIATINNQKLFFLVNVYDQLYVIQNINMVPKMNSGEDNGR